MTGETLRAELRAIVHSPRYRYSERDRQNARDGLVALAREGKR